jgi:hypothetical protein
VGYERKEFVVMGHVSRHNSEKDERHDALWDEVVKKLEAIIDDPKYSEITLMSSF